MSKALADDELAALCGAVAGVCATDGVRLDGAGAGVGLGASGVNEIGG